MQFLLASLRKNIGCWPGLTLVVSGLLSWPVELAAQEPARPALISPATQITPATQLAIREASDWLVTQQHAESGSFGTGPEYAGNVGVTALVGMAFLSGGSTPTSGPYRVTVEKLTGYLLDCAGPNGYLVEPEPKLQGPMYGHGFATMYLAEVLGMSPHPELPGATRRAVSLIINTQNADGGWRYLPQASDADVSVTACQLMALRAARNAGLVVPRSTIERATSYLRRCQNVDGGFRYRLLDAAESRYPRSAACISALYSAGLRDDPALRTGAAYLLRYLPDQPGARDAQYHYYGVYYGAQAAWQIGGEHWERWYQAGREELLRTRQPNAGWSDPWVGDDYATAMALIALQLPYGYVPIFER